MYIHFNPNPKSSRVQDCTVRAISKLVGRDWDEIYINICIEGLLACDMPSANHVWGSYLRRNGYKRSAIPNSCPDCYTVADFARDNPEGAYLLAVPGHVVTVADGDWCDTWDSGNEVPIYYWTKEERN